MSPASLIASIALAVPLLSAEIPGSGMVRSANGTPLEQVWVQELGEVLGSMTGLHVSGLTPEPKWVEGLSSLTVRSIHCGGVQCVKDSFYRRS